MRRLAQRQRLARRPVNLILRLKLSGFGQILVGFVGSTGAVEEQAQRVVRFRSVGLSLQHCPQVRLGGDVIARPKNLRQSHPRVVAIGSAADNRGQRSLGSRNIALLPAIESRTELRRVAMLFKIADGFSRSLLAIVAKVWLEKFLLPAGAACGER